MAQWRIVADENIPDVGEWFAPLGEVRTVAGRSLGPTELGDADILLVRSVTQVNRELLEGSRVRFVGTATIGTDHLDLEYLRARDITWASAPGCNATSVVEYVLSSLCVLDGVLERLRNGALVGIIGLGNVGSRLRQRLVGLGIDVIAYDPLLPPAEYLRPLDEVLAADVVCCHTPLTRAGPYPTRHMLDERRLRQLKPGAVLLNAGRGGMLDNAALWRVLGERDDLRVVLDVWESEPDISRALLERVHIASPHIAGYSFDGKQAGTRMILEACCAFLGEALPAPPRARLAAPSIELPVGLHGVELMRSAMLAAYDVRADDRRMREALVAEGGEVFDRLRKFYPVRRELAAFTVESAEPLGEADRADLNALGFAHVSR